MNPVAWVTGIFKIKGNTDNTKIGNVGDRLKVDAGLAQGSKARIVDMNASNGGVARDTNITSITTYTTIFNYAGSGCLFSFLVSMEGNLVGADAFNVRLEIDDVIVLDVNTSDVGTNSIYGLTTPQDEGSMGLSFSTNILRFSVPKSMAFTYSTRVKVSIKKATSTAAKAFRAGAVYMTKET